ncbi:MAG: PIG-L family deacetylase [Acidobacteria bacterium]|nr:PIG-L family deacetylase [Acidobacteriota bacterium]MBV8891600.1 PIG-L family deacetylase [Acidobacteriota bacterium]
MARSGESNGRPALEGKMLRLLCVTAHPDDEAAAFGGALLLYGSRGVKTYVTCLTAGEAGSRGPTAKSRNELAELRRAEFARACAILRVSHAQVLGYPDGELYHVPASGPVADLAYRIRSIRPQVLLTFAPDGSTGHADHSMASVFATFAFHWAARDDWFVEQLNAGLSPYGVQKLYYLTSEFAFPGRRPLSLAPTTATLDIRDFLEDKIRAFQAHLTQASPIVETVIRQQRGTETYHLAAAVTLRSIEMETDLFSSVVTDEVVVGTER